MGERGVARGALRGANRDDSRECRGAARRCADHRPGPRQGGVRAPGGTAGRRRGPAGAAAREPARRQPAHGGRPGDHDDRLHAALRRRHRDRGYWGRGHPAAHRHPPGRPRRARTGTGLRSYLAIAGGIAVEPVLGSRATDTLSGLGPPVLRNGDALPLGPPGGAPAPVWFRPRPAVAAGPVRLRVRLGPRHDWFTRSALTTFTTATYAVSPLSDRIGARLTGPPLARTSTGELPSEGIVLGAVQVPPDGQPLVLLANHPTTGGYPVIAVVDEADLPLLAQARPGTTVTFSRQE